MLKWLSKFEYTFSGNFIAAALQCLSYQITNEDLIEYPGHFSEIIKWCNSVSSRSEIEKNPLLEGAEALFAKENSLPQNRMISRRIKSAMNHRERAQSMPNMSEVELLIGVMSKPANMRRRSSIRKTWGSHCHTLNCDVVFVLGAVNRDHEDMVKREQDEYGDLLWIKNNLEGMRCNFTRKVGSFLSYALHLQSPYTPRLVMRADDDVYVNVPRILDEGNLLKTPLYWGNKVEYEPVQRFGKYAMARDEFAADVYPPFMSGGRHILSRDLIEILLLHRPILHDTKSLDDVNIGIQLLDVVNSIDDDRFFRNDLKHGGQCLAAIKSQGADDFFVCEPLPSKHKVDSELEWKFKELFALGY